MPTIGKRVALDALEATSVAAAALGAAPSSSVTDTGAPSGIFSFRVGAAFFDGLFFDATRVLRAVT
jgi:hypothetical protein